MTGLYTNFMAVGLKASSVRNKVPSRDRIHQLLDGRHAPLRPPSIYRPHPDGRTRMKVSDRDDAVRETTVLRATGPASSAVSATRCRRLGDRHVGRQAIEYGELLLADEPSTAREWHRTGPNASDRCPRVASADRHVDRVPAACAVGGGRRRLLGLDSPGAVGRADLDDVVAGRGRPVGHPLDPCRVRDRA